MHVSIGRIYSLRTLKIYRDSGFTYLSTTVGCIVVCRYSKSVGLTQMCWAVQACRYCHIVSSAVQIIGSNVEISTNNYLSGFTPLHRKTCTNSKADICNIRGWWWGWRETNEEKVNLQYTCVKCILEHRQYKMEQRYTVEFCLVQLDLLVHF